MTIIWTGQLVQDYHLDWTMAGRPSFRKLLEVYHMDNYWRTMVWTRAGGEPSSVQLLENHHVENYWKTFIWKTTEGPSSRQWLEDHDLKNY
jgi:hypothetical protein